MAESSDPLENIQTRRHLEEINYFLLQGDGEIMESPGKLSLVWTDPVYSQRRFLAVKASGNDEILINGRRYPATEIGLQQGLRACLTELRL